MSLSIGLFATIKTNNSELSCCYFKENLFDIIDTQPVKKLLFDMRFNGGGSPNHYGEVKTLVLPTTKWEVYYSTRYFKNTEEEVGAVVPDQEIPNRFADFMHGIDPVYEFVKSY